MSYPRYPAYKDAGVDWLGEIPISWELKRLGQISAVIDPQPDHRAPAIAEGGGFPYIGIRDLNADGTVNIDTARRVEEEAVLKQEESFHIRKGDIVFCKVGTLGYPLFIKPQQRIALSATLVLIKHYQTVSPDYLRYVLDGRGTYIQIDLLATGSTRLALGIEQIRRLIVMVPPLPEQRAIVAFLDAETARIDALITKQEALIALLHEKRKAVISHAVAKGLDAAAPMKDSGVPWLGDVPAHWEVKKFKHCCSIAEGQVDPKDEQYNNRVLIAPNHIDSGTGRILYTETADEQGSISGKYLVSQGEVVYSKIRPALNKACIAEGDWLCSADMYPIQVNQEMTALYLLYLMLSEPFVRLMVNESMRVAMPKVNRETLTVAPLLVPPIDEQNHIVSYINNETAQIDTLIAKAERFIELLREHRTALIAAAVTGKIDVRGLVDVDATVERT